MSNSMASVPPGAAGIPSAPSITQYDSDDPAYRVFIDTLNYLAPDEIEIVKAAYRFSEGAHSGQKRLSGEPYITHPLAVAGALAEWRMDTTAIVAALLHDVMEDTAVSKIEITERFGREVAELVDGLSKLDRIEFQSYQDAQAENFRKMLMAMARDLRIILIKLADRRHNLETMSAVRPEKRRRIAHETLEIYAPIATRLGLNNISRQLQDLSFRHIHPMRFAVLTKALKAVRGNRRELLGRILDGIRSKLAEDHIVAGVFGREKSLYSIYHKMVDKRQITGRHILNNHPKTVDIEHLGKGQALVDHLVIDRVKAFFPPEHSGHDMVLRQLAADTVENPAEQFAPVAANRLEGLGQDRKAHRVDVPE